MSLSEIILCVEKAPIFINYGLHCSSQDCISHVHYAGITFPHTIYLLCLGLAYHESRRWQLTPFLGGVSHHETAQSVFCVHQCFLVPSTRGIVVIFLLIDLPEYLCILFELGLSWAVIFPRIMAFFSTVVASDVV